MLQGLEIQMTVTLFDDRKFVGIETQLGGVGGVLSNLNDSKSWKAPVLLMLSL